MENQIKNQQNHPWAEIAHDSIKGLNIQFPFYSVFAMGNDGQGIQVDAEIEEYCPLFNGESILLSPEGFPTMKVEVDYLVISFERFIHVDTDRPVIKKKYMAKVSIYSNE